MNMTEIKMIKFKIEDTPLFIKKLDINETLSSIRNKYRNKLPNEISFVCSDGAEIELEDENNFTLKDIIESEGNAFVLNMILKEGEENENESQSTKYNIEKPKKSQNVIEEENEEESLVTGENNSSPLPSWLSDSYSYTIGDISQSNSDTKSEKKNNQQKKANKSQINNKINLNNNYMPPPVAISNNIKFDKKNLSKYKLIEKKGNLDIYLYPSCNFTRKEEIKALSFMVVGETGCGKTTLLNSFINSLLGVDMNDNFRFKIIVENSERSQAYSQTNEVNYYNIRSIGNYPPVKIIDTPGYGDTRGIERDKEITAQIKELFHDKISTLNAICFVTKSSNNRLTPTQKYILSSILDLFGQDVAEIFIFILTFCDGGKPNIIEPLKEKDSPFKLIIQKNKENDWYYKFNNSAIFEDNKDDEFTKMFWKLGIKNFEDFKQKLLTLPKKSLQLSRAVLEQRKYLEEKVQILSRKLKVGLNKIEEIKDIIKMVLNLKGDIDDSKNFTKKITQPAIKKIAKDPNYYATTCLTCTKTCHKHCHIKDDDNKKKCSAMDDKGYCQYCPKKCFWDVHKNRDYYLEDIIEEKTIIFRSKRRINKFKS